MNTHTPAVSCIIPAYNAERFVGPAIESVLAQTTPPAEILVVDDGSTDGTAAVAQTYGDAVQLIQQPNLGTSAARDAGIRAAKHELLAFLDADDLFTPEKIERQREHLLADEALEVSICHSENFWDEQVPAAQRRGVDLSPAARLGQIPTWLIWRSAFDRYGFTSGITSETEHFSEGASWYNRAKAKGLRRGDPAIHDAPSLAPEQQDAQRASETSGRHPRDGQTGDGCS